MLPLLVVLAALATPPNVSLGSLITNVQAISGPWEQQVAPGKVAGVDIEIRTVGNTQRVDNIWIATYVRNQGRSQRTFWSVMVPGEFSWQHNRLALREPVEPNENQPVTLDVTFNSKKKRMERPPDTA